MAYATHQTAHAEREAAAMQLREGKLFVQMLVHRLEEAQRKLEMAATQINATQRLVPSSATYPPVCQQLRERALLDARIYRWGSEVATTQASLCDMWTRSEDDQTSVVSYLSAEDEE